MFNIFIKKIKKKAYTRKEIIKTTFGVKALTIIIFNIADVVIRTKDLNTIDVQFVSQIKKATIYTQQLHKIRALKNFKND